MNTAKIFTPFKLGAVALPQRIVMSPLTRCRAGEGRVPTALMAEYYAQRATAGLIIAEATSVSPCGYGYPNTPGIHTDEQVAGWKTVVDAVHAAGGMIFLQLWHVGRSSHSSYQPGGALPVAPSAIAIQKGKVLAADFSMQSYEVPRALLTEELPAIVAEYRSGAVRAKQAGFDGVEVHCANGYLIDQFLRSSSNTRSDEYGGSIQNRMRFPLQVIDAVCEVWGAARVGVRVSPSGVVNDMRDSDPLTLFGSFLGELSKRRLAFAHIIDADTGDIRHGAERLPFEKLRASFSGPVIAAGGFTPQTGIKFVEEGGADAVAFGRLFIANPDLPARMKQSAVAGAVVPYNALDEATLYAPGPKGYTDYPKMG